MVKWHFCLSNGNLPSFAQHETSVINLQREKGHKKRTKWYQIFHKIYSSKISSKIVRIMFLRVFRKTIKMFAQKLPFVLNKCHLLSDELKRHGIRYLRDKEIIFIWILHTLNFQWPLFLRNFQAISLYVAKNILRPVETGDITAKGGQQYVPIIVFVRAPILGLIFSPFSLSKSFATSTYRARCHLAKCAQLYPCSIFHESDWNVRWPGKYAVTRFGSALVFRPISWGCSKSYFCT